MHAEGPVSVTGRPNRPGLEAGMREWVIGHVPKLRSAVWL
jgi:hypothetical protein